MIRFISFLLGKQYEPCHACEVLKQQLEFERSEKKLLIDTLVNIVSPKVVQAPPVEINQIQQSSALFSRRRAALEERDRQEAKILSEKKFMGEPDPSPLRDIQKNQNVMSNIKGTYHELEKLEKELGVEG